MALHLLKTYPELLELSFLQPHQRQKALKDIFKRDIEENNSFHFRNKTIRPVKGEEPSMQILFKHLTTCKINEQDSGKREYDRTRSERLHWIKYHIEESKKERLRVFSVEDRAKGKKVLRTYILDAEEKYVIILEPYRKKEEYYLLTAYPLLPRNYKKMKKKEKRKMTQVL